MTNKLIASVAASALIAGMTAFAPMSLAQETTTPPATTTQPSTMETAPMDGSTTTTPEATMDSAATDAAPAGGYLAMQSANQIATSTYVGQAVYNAADENIGSINDLIISKDGGVEAAVIGVGGFLGLGEKNVAVPFDNIAVAPAGDAGEIKLTTNETTETLNGAPEFRTLAQQTADRESAVDNATTSSTDTAPVAPATPVTPAPAE